MTKLLRVLTLLSLAMGTLSAAAAISGERKQWHEIILTFDGPQTSEQANPNPFLNYRLNVTFTKGTKSYLVPGYFAADGNAAETSATAGNKWRVHFVPDETGEWRYSASFRTGPEVAVSLDPNAGTPAAFDGETGVISVGPTDKQGRDHRARGMLRVVGEHYTRYAGSGEYFVMAGVQTPENFLAYYGFDQTENRRPKGPNGQEGTYTRMVFPDGLHHYEPHVKDWKPGDPTWKDGKGKGIIGVLNYLAGKGMNTFYSLTMSVESEGRDIWPWTSYEERARYDVSKLGQWEIVFSHMDKMGMQFTCVTQEEESEQLLGKLTTNRKLYYRELVSRFAHHHAIIWDMDEEMDRWRYFTTQDRKDIANYIRDLDPYDHPIQYVQWKGELMDDDVSYGSLLGFPNFDSLGMQHDPENAHMQALNWVNKSRRAGHKWQVGLIEANPGVRPDSDDYWQDRNRKNSIWGNLMAGGSGSIYFFTLPNGDINCEDFRSRDHLFDLQRYAHTFFTKYLPLPDMRNRDDLTPATDDYVFAKDGEVYAIYLPNGGSAELNLSGLAGTFEVKWYDPRFGGELQDGSVRTVEGGGMRAIGNAPKEPKMDWAVLVRRAGPPAAQQTSAAQTPAITFGERSRMVVKINTGMNTKTSRAGDRIRAVVMSNPGQCGYINGVIEEAAGGRLRVRFDTMEFRGVTFPIRTEVNGVTSSKGDIGKDDFQQPVRVEAGTIVVSGPALALEEGGELRMTAANR
jgi:hypothetical protein